MDTKDSSANNPGFQKTRNNHQTHMNRHIVESRHQQASQLDTTLVFFLNTYVYNQMGKLGKPGKTSDPDQALPRRRTNPAIACSLVMSMSTQTMSRGMIERV
jgi:hypothetical protein